MFTKILIANRGEIACRVMYSAHRLGIRTVAVYSDADAHARHVKLAGQAVRLGPAPARESYLLGESIIQAALATGAQAIHPGYGFLSENEDFAAACRKAGLVFIGPPPAAIAAMGSKSAAKALMGQAGVPLVPGYHGENNEPAFLAQEAQRMGYPVLIKASAGGGGKGMRRVDKPEDFAAALASCQREAQASFGDAHVLVERYVNRPRHIEIQVFADSQGNTLHLNERDCSVQRRHQKVLEESPAPGLSAQRRAQMGAAAVAAAKAVGYVGAGTVEFIAEPDPQTPGDLRFYFMEMNTRLQVEHPVTEAVTGLDLVEWQLRVAAGQPLPLTQEQVPLQGHAIEARICAENPDREFLPATGTLALARWPAHVSFETSRSLPRVDGGFGEGDSISPHYDSMIAKLIVWGADRQQALAKLSAALDQSHLVGLSTNVPFLRRVVQSQAFASADLDTALIERERAVLFETLEQPALADEWAVAAVAAHQQASTAQQAQAAAQQGLHEAWSTADGWRHGGQAASQWLHLARGDRILTAALVHQGSASSSGSKRLSLGDKTWVFDWQALSRNAPAAGNSTNPSHYLLQLDNSRCQVAVHALATSSGIESYAVFGPRGQALIALRDPAKAASTADAHAGQLNAPMPGKVLSFSVQVGQSVKAGQALAVMEAMKMEHTIAAPRAGTVAALLFKAGDQVPEGAPLLELKDA